MNKRVELFVPGRLCLFGEHSDWAGRYMAQNPDIVCGRAIVTGINLGIYGNAEKADEFIVNSVNAEGKKMHLECEMSQDVLREKAVTDEYFSYCCGTAAYMRENYQVGGIKLDITKVTLPMKKGLSSSAAICVLVAKAFNELYDIHLSTRGIMKVAFAGELLTRSRCGRLDQACAYGERPIVMDFYDEDISVRKLRVGKTLNWVFADLCAGKDTKKILSSLNGAYPYPQTEVDRNVQEALGTQNHEIIAEACEAIEKGEVERLGEIMTEAQVLFDTKVAPACPEELTSPVLHSVLNDPDIKKWIYGAKGVGSQGDGSVQFLARDRKSQKQLVDYLREEKQMDAYAFDINAGGKIQKAIIPIAGFGTRMYPATHFIKKAFLPVPDEKGVIKPVLLHILEELDSSGIEKIIVIIGENETAEYEKYFHFEYSKDFVKNLPGEVQAVYDEIYELGKKIVFVEQKEKRGFGHAVYQAREYIKNEPVLLMLGDFLYKSHIHISCTEQTMQAYYKSGGKAVVAVKGIPLERASSYGVVHGEFSYQQDYIMDIDDMIEKPSVEIAEKSYLVKTRSGERVCYATFGQYVLTEEIFDYLENQIERATEEKNPKEIDLTAALRNLAKNHLLAGVDVDGESYDVGLPQLYVDTFERYGQ